MLDYLIVHYRLFIMSTRSRIGVQLSDESTLSVYCHFDGYPEFNGKHLVAHHNSRDAARALVNGGDMSCVYDSDDNPHPVHYTSRGERMCDVEPRLDMNDDSYLSKATGEEYHYVYTLDNEWVCYHMHQFTDDAPEVVAIPQ